MAQLTSEVRLWSLQTITILGMIKLTITMVTMSCKALAMNHHDLYSSLKPSEGATVITPILQMRKLRQRELVFRWRKWRAKPFVR